MQIPKRSSRGLAIVAAGGVWVVKDVGQLCLHWLAGEDEEKLGKFGNTRVLTFQLF